MNNGSTGGRTWGRAQRGSEMRRRNIVVMAALLFVGLGAPRPAEAGPWTKNLGELYVKLGQGFFLADSFRDSVGNLQQGVNYLGATTSVYFEVGLFKGLHVWGYLPYTAASNTFSDDATTWLRTSGGDAMLGLQYSPTFLSLPIPTAIKLEVKVPFYDINGVEGIYAGRFPAPGDGQVDVTLWLSAGGSLHPIPLYMYGEVGYRFCTEAFVGTGPFSTSFVDGITFYASVGYNILERVIVAVNSGGVLPYLDDNTSKGYVTLGVALYVPIWRGLAAEASYDPMVYTNKNASPGHGVSFGLSYKR